MFIKVHKNSASLMTKFIEILVNCLDPLKSGGLLDNAVRKYEQFRRTMAKNLSDALPRL